MKLFNTLTQSLEDFVPLTDKKVTMYVCGVTPYDTTHLGHAFTYVTFDTLRRYLEFCGNAVNYVQNVTNIDDDILRKAREVGMAWDELGDRETEQYLRDMDILNVQRPTVYARATDEIPGMIEIIQSLIAKGYAYESGGNVYFNVRKDPDFGIMARAIGLNDYAAMLTIANERGNFLAIRAKKTPLTSFSGRRKHPANLHGPARGPAALAGISSAAPCPCAISAHRLIFMAVAPISPSHTIPVKSRSPSILPAKRPSFATGCMLAWSIRKARK